MSKIPHIQSLSRQNLAYTSKTSICTIFCVKFLKSNTVEEDLNIQIPKNFFSVKWGCELLKNYCSTALGGWKGLLKSHS
jgi:hypothetical protein